MNAEDIQKTLHLIAALDEAKVPQSDERRQILRTILAASQPKRSGILSIRQQYLLRAQVVAFSALKIGGALSTTATLMTKDLLESYPELLDGFDKDFVSSKIPPWRVRELEIEALEKHSRMRTETNIKDAIERMKKFTDGSEGNVLKDRAEIELNYLSLADFQKQIRKEVTKLGVKNAQQVAFSSATHRRSRKRLAGRHQDRMDSQNLLQTASLKKQKRHEFLRTIRQHEVKFKEFHMKIRSLRSHVNRDILAWHSNKEKAERRRKEAEERERLRALKENDEDAYMVLLDRSKNDRLHALIKQTDECLTKLGAQIVQKEKEGGEAEKVVEATEPEQVPPESSGQTAETLRKGRETYYHLAHKITEEVNKQPSKLVGGSLKSYQIQGLQWLVSLYNNGMNGILADEMGLGKTVQTVALVQYLAEYKNNNGPHLIIVPLSTIHNWIREFQIWAPEIRVIMYNGKPEVRKELASQIAKMKFNVVITTSEYTMLDQKVLRKLLWEYLVVDEGHRIKNHRCKLATTLTSRYHSKHRLLLTGTPLQNNLTELWSLLNFLLPHIFNAVESFEVWFNAPFKSSADRPDLSEEEQMLIIRRLHQVLRPFLLRREKKDVEKDLPDRIEIMVKSDLSLWQRKLHDNIKENHVRVIAGREDGQTMVTRVMNSFMELRKVCQHPYLIGRMYEKAMYDPSFEISDEIIRASGKFELLDRTLPKFVKSGHKVLIFTQFKMVMNLLNMYLEYKGMPHLFLDGSIPSADRRKLLQEWELQDSLYRVFVLTTRAGGVGLNLQSADTVILFDSDWNPQMDLQAQSRAHRIGQTREVRVYRFVAGSPIEQVMVDRAQHKLDVDRKVIRGGMFNIQFKPEDREVLLKAIMEHDFGADVAGKVPSYTDINRMIAREDGEFKLFEQMDKEMLAEDAAAAAEAGREKITRLITEERDLPQFFLDDLQEAADHQEGLDEVIEDLDDYGRGRRTRKEISYRDITDREFNKIIKKGVNHHDDEIRLTRGRDEGVRGRRRSRRLGGRESIEGDEGEERSEIASEKSGAYGMIIRTGRRGRPRMVKSRGTDRYYSSKTTRHRAKRHGDDLSAFVKIFNEMRSVKDEAGKLRSVMFNALPDEDKYLDYYELIENPICLDMIETKLVDDEYKSPVEFKADMHEVFTNAMYYNDEDSKVWNDAKAMEEIFNELYEDKFGGREDSDESSSSDEDDEIPLKKERPPRRAASRTVVLDASDDGDSDVVDEDDDDDEEFDAASEMSSSSSSDSDNVKSVPQIRLSEPSEAPPKRVKITMFK